MVCWIKNNQVLCSTAEEARARDRAANKSISDTVLDFASDVIDGVGDTVSAVVHFPEDVVKYSTCTDRYFGERRSWGNFGSCSHWYQPVVNLVDTANSMFYGGIDLVLGHFPNLIFNEGLNLDIPYFSPPPSSVRGIASDVTMIGVIFSLPALKSYWTRKLGLKPKAEALAGLETKQIKDAVRTKVEALHYFKIIESSLKEAKILLSKRNFHHAHEIIMNIVENVKKLFPEDLRTVAQRVEKMLSELVEKQFEDSKAKTETNHIAVQALKSVGEWERALQKSSPLIEELRAIIKSLEKDEFTSGSQLKRLYKFVVWEHIEAIEILGNLLEKYRVSNEPVKVAETYGEMARHNLEIARSFKKHRFHKKMIEREPLKQYHAYSGALSAYGRMLNALKQLGDKAAVKEVIGQIRHIRNLRKNCIRQFHGLESEIKELSNRAWKQAQKQMPKEPGWKKYHTRANLLENAGRFKEAADARRRAERLWHNETSPQNPSLVNTLKNKVNGFMDYYQWIEARYKYATGVATAATAYVGGDLIAQLILSSTQPFDLINLATLVGVSFYYGWETPLTFAKIDAAIPIKKINMKPHLTEMGGYLRGALSGKEVKQNIKASGRTALIIAKDKKGEILRPSIYMGGVSPFWTMRHMALLNLMHSIYAEPTTIVLNAITTWGSTTPITYGLEYVIQNKIPLRYRFLASVPLVMSWQIIASLVTLISGN